MENRKLSTYTQAQGGGRLNRKNIVVSCPENALNKGESPIFDTTLNTPKIQQNYGENDNKNELIFNKKTCHKNTAKNNLSNNEKTNFSNSKSDCSQNNLTTQNKNSFINITLFGLKSNTQTQAENDFDNNKNKIKNKTKLLALIFSLFFIFSTLLASGVFLIVNYVNKTNSNATTTGTSTLENIYNTDGTISSTAVYALLNAINYYGHENDTGTYTAHNIAGRTSDGSGSTVIFPMGYYVSKDGTMDTSKPIYWQAVYLRNGYLTIWMNNNYTIDYFNSGSSTESGWGNGTSYDKYSNYSKSTLRDITNNIYTALNSKLDNFSTFVKSPSEASATWQATQTEDIYGFRNSSSSTSNSYKDSYYYYAHHNGLDSYSGMYTGWANSNWNTADTPYNDEFWIPSYYEVYNTSDHARTSSGWISSQDSLWGLTANDRGFKSINNNTYTIEGGGSTSYCWLRSGYSGNTGFAVRVYSSGSAAYDYVSLSLGVRPAAHLSLSALKNAAESIGNMLSDDGSSINKDTYQKLITALGNDTTSTRNKSSINNGYPVIFQMGEANGKAINWQVVYQAGDIITVWMTDCYTLSVHNTTTPFVQYPNATIRTNVQNIYNTQKASYGVLDSITVSPNDTTKMPEAYITAQAVDGNYGYSCNTGDNTLASVSDKYWLVSNYEAFSLWGLTATDRGFVTTTLDGSSVNYCWLRSGGSGTGSIALLVNSSGSANYSLVDDSYGVRPACHLSLSAIKSFLPTVTLDQQGGSGGTESVVATSGSEMPSITTPTRTGYTFGGYYTGTNGSGTQYYNADGISARNWDLEGDQTLYAKWTGITYYIVYNGNNATSGSMSKSTHTYDTAKALTTNAYSRTGYTFKGWDTSSAGTNVVYQDGASVSNLTSTSGGTVTLYAVWQINSYTITIVSNNTDYGTILNTGGTYNYGSTYTTYAIPKINCALLYWIDNANPNEPIYDNPLTITVTANKTYTAYFTDSLIDGVCVTANFGGSAEILQTVDTTALADTDTLTLIARLRYSGYQFDGWYIQGESTAFSTDMSVSVQYGSIKKKVIIAKFSKIPTEIIDRINTDTNTPDTGGFV